MWAAVGATFMQAINSQDYLWNNKQYLWSSLPGNSGNRIKDCEEKKGGMYENLDDQFTAEQRALSPGEIKSPYGEATNLSKVANNNFFGKH